MGLMFCQACGGTMNKVTKTIGGKTEDYWICDDVDCGYMAPARVAPLVDELAEQLEPEQAD